jgi:hypothetical protein
MEVALDYSLLIHTSASLGTLQVLEAVLGKEAAWQDSNWHCGRSCHRMTPV